MTMAAPRGAAIWFCGGDTVTASSKLAEVHETFPEAPSFREGWECYNPLQSPTQDVGAPSVWRLCGTS